MAVKPIPDGYHAVTPYLVVNDAKSAMEFYKAAFGAVEIMRLPMPDGTVAHGEVRIGDSPVMLGEECVERGSSSPRTLGGVSVHLMIYVDDVDAAFPKAIAAGAVEVRPVQNQFYGDRNGIVEDPYGHKWTLSTHVEDVSEEDMNRRMAAMGSGG